MAVTFALALLLWLAASLPVALLAVRALRWGNPQIERPERSGDGYCGRYFLSAPASAGN